MSRRGGLQGACRRLSLRTRPQAGHPTLSMEILFAFSLRNDLLDTEISHSQLTCYWIDTALAQAGVRASPADPLRCIDV